MRGGGLDRALIAKRIWETCVIPAILYCIEAILIKKVQLWNGLQVSASTSSSSICLVKRQHSTLNTTP